MPTAACTFCSRPATVNGPHWTGSADRTEALAEGEAGWIRTGWCSAPACRAQVRTFPRRAARPRPTMVPATDGNYLAAWARGAQANHLARKAAAR